MENEITAHKAGTDLRAADRASAASVATGDTIAVITSPAAE